MSSIAILIPCYNSELWLEELFNGINGQTIPFTEVICYDDASTDQTAKLAKSLGAKVIVGLTNKGPAFARNRMIEECKSEYIHFHDSDDLIDPRFVEIMTKNLDDQGTLLLCNSYVFHRFKREQNLGNIVYDNLLIETDQLKYFLENVGFASMGFYSKEALTSIGGFNETLQGNEDPDLHIRLSFAGYKIRPVSEYLVTKLEHDNSFSHQNWFQCLSDKLRCLETYHKLLDEKYSVIIGKQAAELSNFFYREGSSSLSKRARKLAYVCNIETIRSSRFSIFVSILFGVKFYLWLYRRRVDLGWI